MASRATGRGTPRRSPRISARSETPDLRYATRSATPSRRALSPELVEQMTPPAASLHARQLLANAQSAMASGSNSNSISIKQEDSSARFFVREPSFQNNLLRGDQRGFHEGPDVNNSHSVSVSIFSSEGDLTDSYQQEEQEVANIQNSQQQRPAPRAVVSRRVSGQRKGRASQDNLPYRPQSDDDDDDDDDIASPTQRTRKGRHSNSIGAVDLGRIDNMRWMNSKSKRGRRKKTANGVPNDAEADDSRDTQADDDAGAASGKETRFDGASDSADSDEQGDQGDADLPNHTYAAPIDKQPSHVDAPTKES